MYRHDPVRATDCSGPLLQIKHTVDNIDKLRTDRMQAAVAKKFPKLARLENEMRREIGSGPGAKRYPAHERINRRRYLPTDRQRPLRPTGRNLPRCFLYESDVVDVANLYWR